MTDKERGLGQRAIGVTNHVIGQKERTFRVARLIFWVHIQRAVGFPKKKKGELLVCLRIRQSVSIDFFDSAKLPSVEN